MAVAHCVANAMGSGVTHHRCARDMERQGDGRGWQRANGGVGDGKREMPRQRGRPHATSMRSGD